MTIKTGAVNTLLILLLLVGLLFLSACGGGGASSSRWDPLAYTVRKGDTLYSIAWRYEKDYRQVAEWNGITPPFAIYPGQRLVMQPSDKNGSASNQARPQVLSEPTTGQVVVIEQPVMSPSATRNSQVIVQRDETLYAIAQREGYSHHQLARWNRLRAPYVLKPGQKLRLTPPAASLGGSGQDIAKTTVEPAPVVASLTRSQLKARPIPPAATRRSTAKSAPTRVASWHWPVKGRVVQTFKASDTSRKGIGIQGRLGQSVSAAAAGTVVYSGNGLINYGNLVIIKHSHSFLSAYAYNQSLLVKEGDKVHSGQVIAKIGQTGSSSPLLHFEIRHNGKPVNPLTYLP
ncbi:MAG TPA: LysM peptidoglycan-binding domain-containing protein [Gammaproteobacteria bacterium]|nr:LysM peptidoglycan-binding domain-containing protein [Gammaproteobacteria bacterium]